MQKTCISLKIDITSNFLSCSVTLFGSDSKLEHLTSLTTMRGKKNEVFTLERVCSLDVEVPEEEVFKRSLI